MKASQCRAAVVFLTTLLASAAPARNSGPPPGEWLAVADSAAQTAFLDTSSIEQTDKGLRAAVKINYVSPQTYGKQTYQSTRNVYILDCAARRLADKENSIYAGTDLSGKRISHASRNNKNLIWRDAAVASVDGELLTSACKRAPQAATQAP